MDNKEKSYKIAVASSDGIVVNQHFGHANQFLVFRIADSHQVGKAEIRAVTPVCEGGNHKDSKLNTAVEALSDCRYVIVSRIGQGALQVLASRGMIVMELPGMIEEAIRKVVVHDEIQQLFYRN